jgi:hypothetical protein
VVDDAAPKIFAAVSKVHRRTRVKLVSRGESCSAFSSGDVIVACVPGSRSATGPPCWIVGARWLAYVY